MSDTIIIWAMICGTVLTIAIGIGIINWLDSNGFFALKKTGRAIEAEKLKAANKELLSGKYI